MRFSLSIIFLGWCLISHKWTTGGQFLPKPSITVSPSAVVLVGENATIRCKSGERYQPAEFTLYKEVSASWPYMSMETVERDEALFHIIRAKPSDAGTYQCYFQLVHHQLWSDYSDKVHIKIKEIVYPKPIISMNPKEGVPLGADVTIQCKSTGYGLAEYYLLKEGSPEPTQVKWTDREAVVFSISSVILSDGGIYWCEYRDSSSLADRYSQASDRVSLHVTDPILTKPLILMKQKGPHVLGANVTIHCQGPEKGLTFLLYKSKDFIASQIAKQNQNRTCFSILMVRQEDAGNYTCQYKRKGNPFVLSEPSETTKLIVKDPHLAKPLIQMELKGQYVLGANITIHCQGPEKGLAFFLYKSMDLAASQIAKPDSNTTTFSIVAVKPENAGNYTCQYQGKGNPFVWSKPSKTTKLAVKDPSLGNPVIEMEPKGPHGLGTNITVHCQGPENGLTFFLYKSVDLVASQKAKPDSNATTFSILMVRLEDAGSYTCQYHGKGNPFVWSEPSVPMNLVVKDRFSTTMWAGIAAGSLLVVLLLLFLFILYRKRRKGSTANDRNQPVNAPQEAEAGEDPSEVSYAVLNLNSLRTKKAASLNSNPEPCVYAVVARNSIRKGP
uniref:immunoglobulin superfamily member 1-like isoform X1 n=1 Tax=Pogona vitticeps TaxID=103695 RepID=UPI003BB8E77B